MLCVESSCHPHFATQLSHFIFEQLSCQLCLPGEGFTLAMPLEFVFLSLSLNFQKKTSSNQQPFGVHYRRGTNKTPTPDPHLVLLKLLEASYMMSGCFVPHLFKPGAQQSNSSRESTKPCPVVCAHAWMICPKQAEWWSGRDTPALSTPSSSLLRPTENPSCIIAKTQRHAELKYKWEQKSRKA